MRYFFILLLCSLIVSLAGAVPNPVMMDENLNILEGIDSSNGSLLDAHEGFNGEWEKIVSLPEQEYSNLRISSKNLADFNPELFPINDSNKTGAHRTDSITQFQDIGRPSEYYLSKFDEATIKIDKLFSDSSTNTLGLKYIYQIEDASPWQKDHSYSLGDPDDELQIAYPNRPIAINSQDWIDKIVPYPTSSEENELKIRTSYGLYQSDQERVDGQLETFDRDTPIAGSEGLAGESLSPQTLEFEDTSISPYSIDDFSGINNPYISDKFPAIKKKKKNPKNYAIVVGIDEYKDRMSLHTCANDAKSVADLMSELGYNVVLLSDQTEERPTKSNILDDALKEIKYKQDLGNVIFYFSGHGVRACNGTFYLIPQDADGNTSSYISEDEIKQQIKDIKNLALIIDACNSEGLSPAIGNGQLIMASSMDNQSSNEEWTGSMSVFTSNLIKAIKEESQRSDRILLQNCFRRAYNDTVGWSRVHFISQTPVITDLTGGIYYIN